MIDIDAVVPAGPLGAFLNKHLGDSDQPLGVEKVGQGRSNLTFKITRGSEAWILRRPPMGDLPETAHDMMREYRVLSGLAGTQVRAPRPVLACSNPNVIGVPFYLMEVVEGLVIRDQLPEQFTIEHRAAIGEQMIDALAELHTVDPSSVGLGDLGKPEGYTARQVARWSKQWGVMATRELPDIEAVRSWLEGNVPQNSPTAIVHGDYKLDNVVFGTETPPRLRAIFDWEMATLGDPLADLGYLMMFWPEAHESQIGGLPQPTQMKGFLPRQPLIERYEARTGFAMTDLNFYRTLALWKLAILTEGLYKRYLAGKADSDWFAVLETAVPQMAAVAREWSGA